MKKALIATAVALLMAGTTFALRPDLFDSSYPSPHTKALWQEVRAAAVEQLLDPESAKFSCVSFLETTLKDGEKLYSFVGEINAKNRMGGYTGKTSFSWSEESEELPLNRDHYVFISDKRNPYLTCPEVEHFK